MPTLTIDGERIEVPAGTTILQAAQQLGHEVPYFCYHPKLSRPANCRQCLVEVKGVPKLLASCYTVVGDDMEVSTRNERVQDQQRRNMEFILLNHPVDCPICDQAGECKLQDYYRDYDFKPSRLNILPVHKPKVIRLGAKVVLDAERCILCTRCVRFFEEVVNDRPLGVFQRGNKSELALYPGKALPEGYARNVVDICPVGALTSEDFRFNKRVWFLTRTPSVCSGCARGCNITVEHHEGDVFRYKPRDNDDVNEGWICDDGAFGYKFINQHRVTSPQVRRDDALAEVTWDEALGAAAELLRGASAEKPMGFVLSPQATCEDNWAFVRLGREALGNNVRFYLGGKPDWEADRILKVADQNPNSLGTRLVVGDALRDAAGLRADLAKGNLHGVLLIGGDLPDAETLAALAGVERLVLVVSNQTPLQGQAQVVLAACTFAEKDGTFVNFQGRAQQIQAGPRTRGRSGPEWKIALRLGEKLAHDFGWTGAADLLTEIREQVPAFAGLDVPGELGTVLPGVAEGASAPAGA